MTLLASRFRTLETEAKRELQNARVVSSANRAEIAQSDGEKVAVWDPVYSRGAARVVGLPVKSGTVNAFGSNQ